MYHFSISTKWKYILCVYYSLNNVIISSVPFMSVSYIYILLRAIGSLQTDTIRVYYTHILISRLQTKSEQ